MELSKKRDYVFDNIKGVLTFLVVFGHVIETFSKKNVGSTATDVFMFIYLFHMPFFVFISGYFSKKHNTKKILEVIILYAFCQMILYPIGTALITGTNYYDHLKTIFSPQKVYWYLFALAVWRMITPYIMKIKWFLPISFVLGITLGYTLGKADLFFLSIGRIISFYPFFLLGYVTDKEFLDKLKGKIPRIVSVLAIGSILVFSYFYIRIIAENNIKPSHIYQIAFGAKRYASYLVNPKLGWIFKSILYVAQVVIIYATILITKNKKTLLSKIGNASLLIYATHIIFLQFYEIKLFERYNVRDMNEMIFLAISFAVSLIYCLICTIKPVEKIGAFILALPSKIIKD